MPHMILTILKRNRTVQGAVGLILSDIAVFSSVDPRKASAGWLIIGYVLIALTAFGICHMIADTLRGYGSTAYHVGSRLLKYVAIIIVGLIGLQSIGQLTTKDIVTMLPLAVLAYWYFGYGKSIRKQPTSNVV